VLLFAVVVDEGDDDMAVMLQCARGILVSRLWPRACRETDGSGVILRLKDAIEMVVTGAIVTDIRVYPFWTPVTTYPRRQATGAATGLGRRKTATGKMV
jgi:hypothetical protein